MTVYMTFYMILYDSAFSVVLPFPCVLSAFPRFLHLLRLSKNTKKAENQQKIERYSETPEMQKIHKYPKKQESYKNAYKKAYKKADIQKRIKKTYIKKRIKKHIYIYIYI